MQCIVGERMEKLTIFALFNLTIINFVLYHKMFRVYYFGDLGHSLFKEIAGCAIAAAFELALIIWIGGFILKALIIIVLIIAIIRIFKNVKSGKVKIDGWTITKLVMCGVGLLIMLIPGLFDNVVDSIKNSKDNESEYVETTSNSESSESDEKKNPVVIGANITTIDLYDYRRAKETEILNVLGYESNENSIYPNEEERVFACVNEKMYAISITEDTDERFTFLDIEIGKHITSIKDKLDGFFVYSMAGDTWRGEDLLQAYYLEPEGDGSLQVFFDKDTYLIDSILYVVEASVQDFSTNIIAIEGLTPENMMEEMPENEVPENETQEKRIYEYNNLNNNTSNEYDVTVVVEYINDNDGYITFYKSKRYNEDTNEEKYEFSFTGGGSEIYNIKGELVECSFYTYFESAIEITDKINGRAYIYDIATDSNENMQMSEAVEVPEVAEQELTEQEVLEPEVPTYYEFVSWDDTKEIIAYVNFYTETKGSINIRKTIYGSGSPRYEAYDYTFSVADEEDKYLIYDEYTGYQNMYFSITSEDCFIMNICDENTGTIECYLEKEYAYNNVG